jgi:hypothetical protein
LNEEADKIEVSLEASSQFHFEPELTEVIISAASMGTEAPFSNAEIVDFEDNRIQLSLVLSCNVEAVFSVSFEHWDSVDREYMGMGSSDVRVAEDVDVEMLLAFQMEDGIPVFVGATPERTSFTFDGGELEPDWMNERSPDDY